LNAHFDIAIVGSGFAGSLLAMIGRRLGRSVVLLERNRHPRFAIGESSTPLANLLLDELARRYDLPEIAPLTKWGTWQRARPEIACGLKRGFTFYHHESGKEWTHTPDRANELLVAASPHNTIADTHWYRADFDEFLVRQAQAAGAVYLDDVKLDSAKFEPGSAMLTGQRAGQPFAVKAAFVIDATGPRGFLHRALGLRETGFPVMPSTHGLYSHFRNVKRWDALHLLQERPPYPVDDAAVHHVFDGGWIWVLCFNNGVTSAGVAATERLARELNFAEGSPAWQRLLDQLPSVREQFEDATPLVPFIHTPRLTFRSERACGAGWALLPSAAGFVDPLLSTGFPLTLLGVQRLAVLLEQKWNTSAFEAGLSDYSSQTLAELDITGALVGALYGNMHDFARFTALTLLYFAAASYSETARRLKRPELAPGFLLRGHERFRDQFEKCLHMAGLGCDSISSPNLIEAVRAAIQPINMAGLADPARRNWYPALAEDLLSSAAKLGVDQSEIKKLLHDCGFYAKPVAS
jgi:tetracycline 7-halogenase / FADH2 O2-dependent halogenase